MTKNRRFSKKSISPFLIVISVIFIFLSFALSLKIKKDLSLAVWDGKGRFNIMVNAKDPYLFSYEPQNKTLLVLKFPGNLYEETAGDYGKYKLGSVYKLDALEKKQGKLFRKTFSNLLEIPVDAYFASTSKKWQINTEENNLIQNYKNKFSGFTGIFIALTDKNLKTNLTSFDLCHLWLNLQGVRITDIVYSDLQKENVFLKKNNSELLSLDKVKFNSLFNNSFTDHALNKENITVEVRNATEKSGLGNSFSNLLNNLGIQVVDIGMGKGNYNSLCQINQKAKKSSTLEKIRKLTNCSLTERENKTADIVILLGNNYLLLN